MQHVSAGSLINLQGITEGAGELWKTKGDWNTGNKNLELTLFATKFPERILLRLVVALSGYLRALLSLWNYMVTQPCLWETGVHSRKLPTYSAALSTIVISDWVVSIWVNCRKASLGHSQLPFRNKIQFNPRNSYHIPIAFIVVSWTLQKERQGACFKELAIRYVLCLKREERQEGKEVTPVVRAKISLHPSWLASL